MGHYSHAKLLLYYWVVIPDVADQVTTAIEPTMAQQQIN